MWFRFGDKIKWQVDEKMDVGGFGGWYDIETACMWLIVKNSGRIYKVHNVSAPAQNFALKLESNRKYDAAIRIEVSSYQLAVYLVTWNY